MLLLLLLDQAMFSQQTISVQRNVLQSGDLHIFKTENNPLSLAGRAVTFSIFRLFAPDKAVVHTVGVFWRQFSKWFQPLQLQMLQERATWVSNRLVQYIIHVIYWWKTRSITKLFLKLCFPSRGVSWFLATWELIVKLTAISIDFDGGKSHGRRMKKSEKSEKSAKKFRKIRKSGPKIEGFLNPKKSRTPFCGVIHPSFLSNPMAALI